MACATPSDEGTLPRVPADGLEELRRERIRQSVSRKNAAAASHRSRWNSRRPRGASSSEPPTTETPETLFDRRWALTLLDRVLGRIRTEMCAAGKEAQFNALSTYLSGDRARSYAETAAELSMSDAAVKVAVHRLRRRYRDVLREEISHTVSAPEEIDDELRHLWSAVSR